MKYKIYNMRTFSYSKFRVYTHPVNSKFHVQLFFYYLFYLNVYAHCYFKSVCNRFLHFLSSQCNFSFQIFSLYFYLAYEILHGM